MHFFGRIVKRGGVLLLKRNGLVPKNKRCSGVKGETKHYRKQPMNRTEKTASVKQPLIMRFGIISEHETERPFFAHMYSRL